MSTPAFESPDQANQHHAAGPLPKFEGVSLAPTSPTSATVPPNALQSQGTGSIRIPPLTPDKIAQYSGLFERSGQQNGTLAGKGNSYTK